MENLTIKVIKLEMENDDLKRDYLKLDETNKNHVLRIIQLMQEIEQLKANQWTSVDDRLPEHDNDDLYFVLVNDSYTPAKNVPFVTSYEQDGIYTGTGKACPPYWEIEEENEGYKVAYWMPVPKLEGQG